MRDGGVCDVRLGRLDTYLPVAGFGSDAVGDDLCSISGRAVLGLERIQGSPCVSVVWVERHSPL